jgi:LmbE family N-acetylglucosaminyl deacetylase
MATLLCFHAHPDDEAIATGGTMARAAAAGHRVILVVATGGEHGETPADLAAEETLADRRAAETRVSATALGFDDVRFLGYRDSGMTGWDQNANPEAFMNAPLDQAAQRLADILRSENVDVLTHYDWHGNYGHPDHVMVHKVGKRAAELAQTPYVYEATMNRDHIRRMMEAAKASGADVPDFGDEEAPNTDDGNPFGMAETELTTAVDVTGFVSNKRAAMRAHRSQITDGSFFLEMPEEMFAMSFGTEWFIRQGHPVGISEDWLAGLETA